MSAGTVVTAGDVATYVEKLSKLGVDKLKARIATINRKTKIVERMISTGKFAKAAGKGPRTVQQAKYVLRGLGNALKWHTDALDKASMATAATDPVGSLMTWADGYGLEVKASANRIID